MKLFGTDGIRSIVGEHPLTSSFIPKICDTAAFLLKKVYKTDKVYIGWDTRESSPWIAKLVAKSFVNFGYKVYMVGVFTTGGVAYLCKKDKSVGVVISASHNPYQYNGIKFLSPEGTKIKEKFEQKIESLVEKETSLKPKHLRKGQVFSYTEQAKKLYSNFLLSIFKETIQSLPVDEISLVVDCGNGATSRFVPELFPSLFSNVKFINITPDGKNINANCGALYPETVKKYMNGKQIGITFDGDADRVIFVDEQKNIRDGDYIIGILATEYKKRKKLKNSLVVVSIMSNLALVRYLQNMNVKVITCPVGDKYVSDFLKQHRGNLGGEQAGHVVIYDYLPTGDGIITAIEVLKIVIKNKTSLYKLCQIFTKYPQVLKNVKTEVKPELSQIFDHEFIKSLEEKIDGRIVLRYSGTEPLFRIMVEGKDKNKIKKTALLIEKKFLDYIEGAKLCQS